MALDPNTGADVPDPNVVVEAGGCSFAGVDSVADPPSAEGEPNVAEVDPKVNPPNFVVEPNTFDSDVLDGVSTEESALKEKDGVAKLKEGAEIAVPKSQAWLHLRRPQQRIL